MSYGAGSPGWSTIVSQYDIANSTEHTHSLGFQGVGVAVDELTGYLYMTVVPPSGGTYPSVGSVRVYDPTDWSLIDSYSLTGSPAGIGIGSVSYNPLNLTKDDGLEEYECVYVTQDVTYDICFDNAANNFPVTSVTIVDTLPPETSFVSATGGGVYNSATHEVTWTIGNLPAGDPGGCLQLVVTVDSRPEIGFIVNYTTIASNETPPTTVDTKTGICEGSLEIEVSVDIKPGSCPNPINTKSKGVLPVAICGTEDFDVMTIDPASIELTIEGLDVGVAPLRWSLEDVATPYTGDEDCCHELNGDGYLDMTFKSYSNVSRRAWSDRVCRRDNHAYINR
jgi:uncharacterized repeat protein (TIGR01451 family)